VYILYPHRLYHIKDLVKMSEYSIIIDGVKWYIDSFRHVKPLCPKHHLPLYLEVNDYNECYLKCEECANSYMFKREFNAQKQYILDKLDSKMFKNMRFINLDDEAIPIAEAKASSKDNKYFATAVLTESKVGKRLVVYAGEKGKPTKTQIFVEPEIKRLSFDQKDLHPADVFTKLEATFDNGDATVIKKSKKP